MHSSPTSTPTPTLSSHCLPASQGMLFPFGRPMPGHYSPKTPSPLSTPLRRSPELETVEGPATRSRPEAPISKFHSPKSLSPISGTPPGGSRGTDQKDLGRMEPLVRSSNKTNRNTWSNGPSWRSVSGEVESYQQGFREGFRAAVDIGIAKEVGGKMVNREEVRIVNVGRGHGVDGSSSEEM
jgi:hypothetical protein